MSPQLTPRRGEIRLAYRSAYPEPLVAVAGEVLALEDREAEWPGWIWGVHRAGRAGWIPEPYLDRDGDRGVLRRDYDATELTVAVGETVTALVAHGGWLRCRAASGAVGWVPAEHVTLESAPTSVALDHAHPLPDRQQVTEALLGSEEAYRALVDHALQGLFITQGTTPRIVFANETIERISGYSAAELCSMSFEQLARLVPPEDTEAAFGHYAQRLAGLPAPERLEYRLRRKDGRIIWVEELVTTVELRGDPAIMAAVVDITDRKRAESEREQLITDLKVALSKAKTLGGVLPLCSHCKKVRDGDDRWRQVELYIVEETGREVSHSLCPDCVRALYPDYQLESV